jgi:hypothetical protein
MSGRAQIRRGTGKGAASMAARWAGRLAGGLLVALAWTASTAAAQALPCTASTPEQAVQQWLRAQSAHANTAAATWTQPLGYGVLRILRDPILGQSWAEVQDCAHPSRPLIAIALPGKAVYAEAVYAESQPRADREIEMQASEVSAAAHRAAPFQTLPQLPAYQPVSVHLALAQTEQASPIPTPVLVRAGDRVTLWNQEPDLQMNLAAIALEYGRAGQIIHLRRTGGFGKPEKTIAGVVRAAGSVELLP